MWGGFFIGGGLINGNSLVAEIHLGVRQGY